MEFDVEELIREIEVKIEENILEKEKVEIEKTEKEKDEDKIKISYISGIDAAYDKVLDIINNMLAGKKETVPVR